MMVDFHRVLTYIIGLSKSSGGSSNYNDLSNKPQINSVTLSGDKSNVDLGIALILTAESHKTVEGYEVPVLTNEQIIQAYNGIVAGKSVYIIDDLDTISLSVIDGSTISSVISIRAIFTDKLILKYTVDEDSEEDEGTITGVALGGIPSGNTLPSGQYVGQLYILLVDVGQTKAGLYRYNGSLWERKAQRIDLAIGENGKPKHITSVDLNTISDTGFYSCDTCTNRPNDSNGTMLVVKNGGTSDNLVQVYWTFQNDVMYVRHKDLGTWKDWVKILKNEDVVNNLTETSEGKVLDARQGKTLDEKKEDKIKTLTLVGKSGTLTSEQVEIINSPHYQVNHTDTTTHIVFTCINKNTVETIDYDILFNGFGSLNGELYVISIRIYKESGVYKYLIGTMNKVALGDKINISDIANNLITTEEGKVLDARQGKALNDKLSVLVTSTNKALSESEVDEKIANVEARQLYKDNTQHQFANKEELLSATTYYKANGEETIPTLNDIVYVEVDETKGNLKTKYTLSNDDPITWAYVISFKEVNIDNITIGLNDNSQITIKDTLLSAWNRLVTLFTNITSIVTSITDNDTDIPTSKAVSSALGNKVNTSDIVNDLTAGGTTKVLSAEQGKVLKTEIDEKDVYPPDNATIGLNDSNQLEVMNNSLDLTKLKNQGSSNANKFIFINNGGSIHLSEALGVSVPTTIIAVTSDFTIFSPIAYRILPNIYFLSFALQNKTTIPANTEKMALSAMTIDGHTKGIYQPLSGSYSTDSSLCSGIVYSSGNVTQFYINCPKQIPAGGSLAFSGLVLFTS